MRKARAKSRHAVTNTNYTITTITRVTILIFSDISTIFHRHKNQTQTEAMKFSGTLNDNFGQLK